jgi:hypothetical protein
VKKLSEKEITPVKSVMPPFQHRFNCWVHFLSSWTSRWRSTDDLFEVHRFNQWTPLLESRKMLSIGMNWHLQLYHRFKWWTHPVTLCQWECINVLFFWTRQFNRCMQCECFWDICFKSLLNSDWIFLMVFILLMYVCLCIHLSPSSRYKALTPLHSAII